VSATAGALIPNPANWADYPPERRSGGLTPPDHAMRVRPNGRAIKFEIDMPAKKGIAGWCLLEHEKARSLALRLIRYADEAHLAAHRGA
jgi:hypothetical protein